MQRKLWELDSALQDLHELIAHTEDMAIEVGGGSPGRPADPEHGIPEEAPEDGWPLMNQLSDALGGMRLILAALRANRELTEAIDRERVEDYEDEARADAASY